MKSPLNYSLVRNISCLDPQKLIKNEVECIQKFKRVLTVLVNSKRLRNEECDIILREFKTFVNSMQTNEEFKSYRRSDSRCRLDTLYHDNLAGKPDYEKSWPVIRQLLLLSHGQATVEGSFSINKGVTTTNLSAQTLVARRAIIDHVHHVGGMHNDAQVGSTGILPLQAWSWTKAKRIIRFF